MRASEQLPHYGEDQELAASIPRGLHSRNSDRLGEPREDIELRSGTSRSSTPQNGQNHPSNPDTAGLMEEEEKTEDKKEDKSSGTVMTDWFILEILGVLLSAGILIAMFVILNKFDNQPQPDWEHMSLNSLISWLITISKACLLFSVSQGLGQLKWIWFAMRKRPLPNIETFDSASRGFFGSARLIWMLRGRHFAVWGNIATILALAFDPSVQNLTHYYSGLAEDSSQQALLANTTVYDSYGSGMVGADPFVDPVLKGNVYNALFNNDATKPWAIPQYVCPSGNCSWDPLATLEIRTLCANVTDHLNITQTAGDATNETSKISISLPNNLVSVWYDYEILTQNKLMAVSPVSPQSAIVYTNASFYPIQYIAPRGVTSLNGGTFPIMNTSDVPFEATECTLEPIVRSFQATVFNGTYRDRTLAVWAKSHSWSKRTVLPPYSASPTWNESLGMQHNQTFKITDTASDALGTFVEYLFSGSYQQQGAKTRLIASQTQEYATTDTLQALMTGNMTGCGVEASGKLYCAMENVAAAITKSIRDSAFITADSDPLKAQMASGRAMSSVTFVSVRWPWVTLPILVWLLGAVTVIGTGWKTRRAKMPSWSNDPLPLLFLYRDSPDDGVNTSAGGNLANQIEVRLQDQTGRMVLE